MSEGIAIIGLAGRFPGARDVAHFWANLCAGTESVATFTDEQLLAAGVSAAEFNDPAYVRCRAVLADPEWFDAAFFGFTPRDAELTDPQQRVFLECCWEAFEDAGVNPEDAGAGAGVFAAVSLNSYWLRQVLGGWPAIADFTKAFQADAYNVLVGADKDYLATRVAYKLDLRGPAMTIQTACSSSLVAVAQACASLQTFQCDLALAGGASISFPQERGHFHQEGAIPSADGHCRAFDARASGTVFGAGCGVVLLKRLEDAVRDGDHVYAVIRAAALNNDGADKMSFSAPSQSGQAGVIALAHALAGVSADSISYVEAHGTGTPLGDPIEVAALTQAFRTTTDRTGYCALGSLKTNVGHLEAAAGVAGLIKTALALRHRLLPATLHYQSPNPNIDFAGSPFFVVAKPRAWEDVSLPRRAGVSSFGVGGTNAHAVLEEAPEREPSGPARPQQLLLLSARTPAALDALSRNLADWLENPPSFPLSAFRSLVATEPSAKSDPLLEVLADAAYTLQVGRKTFTHRRALVASSPAEAVGKLRAPPEKAVLTGQPSGRSAAVVFLFPGQGAQYAGMGAELYRGEPVFREEVDRCAEILRTHLGTDIRTILHPAPEGRAEAEQRIHETAMTQPSIFVVEYALAKLWQSWGLQPSVMIGHSIGEYVCAVLAETFALADALALLAVRAKLMQALPAGSMLAVRLPGAEVEPLLPPGASIAAYNSAKLCTVSGPTEVLSQFQQELEGRKVAAKRLSTSHAFHSAMMDPLLAEFTAAAERAPRQPPKLPWISSCTGAWMTADAALDARYWGRQLREPVRFVDALDAVFKEPLGVILEVGPGQTLGQLVRQHSGRPADLAVVSSLPAGPEGKSELDALLSALGRLWIAGVKPDWAGFHADERRHRLSLPTYPFERRRFWLERTELAATGTTPVLDRKAPPALVKKAGQALTAVNHHASTPALTDPDFLEHVIQEQLSAMKEQLRLLIAKQGAQDSKS